jgi:protein-tyrosine phosphatase
MKTLLFLCTANYYRSRFAEEMFNHRAFQAGVTWVAQSRGLAVGQGIYTVGRLSPLTLQALTDRGLVPRCGDRLPQQCGIADLQSADHIVALDEAEHRPLMFERFPRWADRIEYWRVADIEYLAPHIAVNEIECQIEDLLRRLPV